MCGNLGFGGIYADMHVWVCTLRCVGYVLFEAGVLEMLPGILLLIKAAKEFKVSKRDIQCSSVYLVSHLLCRLHFVVHAHRCISKGERLRYIKNSLKESVLLEFVTS